MKQGLKERFISKVDKNGPIHPELKSPCWFWTAHIHNGYGRFHFRHKNASAHRVSYLLFKSEIPRHLTVDHICNVTKCVNPDHLQLLTRVENIKRVIHYNSLKTHCQKGHPYDRSYKDGRRYCLRCHNEYTRTYKARVRSKEASSC